jgi:Short C-terminal domain
MGKMTPEAEARYALDWNVARSDLSAPAQREYDRLRKEYAARMPGEPVDATFPALGVQVRGDRVERCGMWIDPLVLGPLAGAQAQLTDGSQAWSPGRAVFLPISFAGLATKTKAHAFVIFPDGSYHEQPLDGNKAVRDAQGEALKFNLLASPPDVAQPAQPAQDDTAATLRKLAGLHDEGLLTDEEYAAKRAEVIARI